jgi:hypothetical protein
MSFRDWLNDRRSNDGEQGHEFIAKNETDAAYLPMSTLLRWYLYDLEVERAEEFAQKYLDIPPISQEGMDMERKDSEERMARVKEYESIAQAVAEINGYIISMIHEEGFEEAIKENHPELSELDLEQIRAAREESAAFLDQVGFAACLFMLSIGFNLGLIQPGPSEAIRNFPHE